MTDNKYEYIGSRKHRTLVGSESNSPWDQAAAHRAHVLKLLRRHDEGRKGMICVWGVGDGTALDLQALLDRHHEVHLVDREPDRIKQIIDAQEVTDPHRIRRFGVDVGGVHDLLARYASEADDQLLEQINETIVNQKLPNLGDFEVIVSLSQLSRLTRHLSRCLGTDSETALQPLVQLRQRHLELLVEHTRPGGNAVLVTDLVSSRTLPELLAAPVNLNEVLNEAFAANNFYPGIHPGNVDDVWMKHERFENKFDAVNVSKPWLRPEGDAVVATMAYRVTLKGE
ncbi:MAG: hypothetical protein ACR2NP_17420 [Pirellulaceae bacterium]